MIPFSQHDVVTDSSDGLPGRSPLTTLRNGVGGSKGTGTTGMVRSNPWFNWTSITDSDRSAFDRFRLTGGFFISDVDSLVLEVEKRPISLQISEE